MACIPLVDHVVSVSPCNTVERTHGGASKTGCTRFRKAGVMRKADQRTLRELKTAPMRPPTTPRTAKMKYLRRAGKHSTRAITKTLYRLLSKQNPCFLPEFLAKCSIGWQAVLYSTLKSVRPHELRSTVRRSRESFPVAFGVGRVEH